MNNKNGIAEKLLQTGAVQLRPTQPYTWASGWKSPIYCDNRKLLSFPYVRDYIKSELCNMIYEIYPKAQLIAGVATAGIAWGAMVADQLKLPFIYVRPKPKEHGLGNQIEGQFVAGQKTVVVEDLISTGKSSLQVVDVLRKAGLDIMGMAALFTYQFEEADNNFAKAKVQYQSLTDYGTLIAIAMEKGRVHLQDEAILLKWRKDPAQWNYHTEG
jgi:orotate phosphoribosyltransferase